MTATPPPGRTARTIRSITPASSSPAQEAEPALAEADGGIELGVIGELAHVEYFEPSRELLGGGGSAGELDEVGREVDAGDVDTAAGERERVAPGPAPDVEHPHPRLQTERADEELDLLLGALGESHYPAGTRRPVRLPEKPRDPLNHGPDGTGGMSVTMPTLGSCRHLR